jgi:hypothetical protein
MSDVIKLPYMAEEIQAAVWAAYRNGKTSWIDDEHGHIAAIIPATAVFSPKNGDARVMTLNEAGILGDLVNAVGRGDRLRYYPYGADESDATMHVVEGVLRAFTLEGGGFYPNNKDVRDAYVWVSGFTERWYKVSDLILALDNNDGKHGLDKPIAVIDIQ